jgi:hypothetical protein
MAEHVGGGGGIHIQADGAGIFGRAAPDVQNAGQIFLRKLYLGDLQLKMAQQIG